jgi:hypothetical protein
MLLPAGSYSGMQKSGIEIVIIICLFLFQSTLRTSLKEGAIPTRFDFTSHLNNPSGHNRNKRIREPVSIVTFKTHKWFKVSLIRS